MAQPSGLSQELPPLPKLSNYINVYVQKKILPIKWIINSLGYMDTLKLSYIYNLFWPSIDINWNLQDSFLKIEKKNYFEIAHIPIHHYKELFLRDTILLDVPCPWVCLPAIAIKPTDFGSEYMRL